VIAQHHVWYTRMNDEFDVAAHLITEDRQDQPHPSVFWGGRALDLI